MKIPQQSLISLFSKLFLKTEVLEQPRTIKNYDRKIAIQKTPLTAKGYQGRITSNGEPRGKLRGIDHTFQSIRNYSQSPAGAGTLFPLGMALEKAAKSLLFLPKSKLAFPKPKFWESL
jgi:hypothetical protein